RNCSRRGRRKREIPALHSRRGGKMLSCVRVREDGCACGVQPFVTVGMVKVPMRVDQVLDRIGADLCQCGCGFWTRTRITAVDEHLTVPAGKDGDISTCA